MAKKSFMKNFTRGCARISLYVLFWLFERLPYSVVRVIAIVVLRIGYVFLGRHKRISEESLKIAFGKEKSDKEIHQIMRRCFSNFGEGMVEMLYFATHPELVLSYVEMEGKEHLDQALAKGKGVIALTGHFGNFPLMMLYAVKAGYPTHCLIRPARDEQVSEYLHKKRDEIGLKTIFTMPRHRSVVQSLRVLRSKEVLFLLGDQHFGGKGGVLVEFFGQQAATAPGPIILAKRSGAAIVPMFIVRQPNGRHKIFIEPEMKIDEFEDENVAIQENVRKMTRIIEKYVRLYPYEWSWMHRRWKSISKED